MKMLYGIVAILLVVLLGIAVLDRLGASEVTDKVGEYVREKAGVGEPAGNGPTAGALPGRNGEPATMDENALYVKGVLGWDLRDLQSKPLEAVRRGIVAIDAEIARLRELRAKARVEANRRADDNSEVAEELAAKRAWMKDALAALDNPETTYPVKVGGYEYTEEMLLSAINSTGERIEALKATLPFGGGNLEARSKEALATIQTTMELLQRTKALLLQQEKWFETANTIRDANESKGRASEFKRHAEAILSGEDVAEEIGGTGASQVDNQQRMRDKVSRWREAMP